MMARAKWLVFVLLLGLPLFVSAQYSNSWINFSQQYYKIPVAQEGIYRLTYSNLQASGFPVTAIDPRFIQLFHRGQEQSIYVKGQGDGVFNSSDYIEFYGQKNDGALDSLLYRPSSMQPHKYYNLYSDTTTYFLTYGLPQRGLRMDSVQLVNVNNLPVETYQYSKRLFVFHEQYSAGLTASDLVNATTFDQGEGWTGNALQQGQTIDYVIDSLFNGTTSAGNPKFELLLVGRDFIHHDLQVFVGANSAALRLLASPSFNGFSTYLVSSDLNWSDIGSDGKMLVRITALSASTNRYQASASFVKITFPQSFNWSGQRKKDFSLEVKPVGQSYLSITNPAPNLRMWDITDLQNITRIQPISSNPFNAIVPATSTSKKLYTSSTVITPSIIPASFRQINPSGANFLIITNRVLMKPAAGYADPVKAYGDYRASQAGGSYDTLVITIDQLYNQFNYGEVSPLAIYSFMKFMSQGNVKYLFLIGKGRDISYSAYQRKPVQPTEFRDLVPSAGYPGGDIAFTAGLSGTTYEPSVPTGRLTANTPEQVAAYLNKVKELESKPAQPWNKELLHLSGGGGNHPEDAFEITIFRSFVDGFKKIAEGPYLGGHVATESKATVDLEQINVSTIVNQGVNLITFFGHSDSFGLDIDIGFVSNPTLGYNNPGKYPVFLINGCNAGTIFSNAVTFGEDWMLAANKGSRNFIAGTSFGYSANLNYYSTLLYQVGFADSTFIAKGIGDIQKEASKRYLQNISTNIYSIAQIQQMVLAGDPSLKLFGTNKPDYAIDNGSISMASLDNKPVTSLSDSFALKIVVKNLGAYSTKPMTVRVIRTFNDNSTKSYDSTFSPILYIDTLTFKLRKESTDGFGNNLFTVIIDPLNTVKELNESNNIGTLNLFIPSNGTINLYPPNFGIVNSTSISLIFQDANLLGAQRNFLIQIDTASTFNSPFLQKQTVSGKVLAKAATNLLQSDSIVYYWRTRPVKTTATDSSNWSVSSFIFIKNSPEGWAQAKLPQVATNSLTGLEVDLAQNKMKYLETVTTVNVKSIGSTSASPYSNASIKIKGVEYNVGVHFPCRNNTINLVAFDKSSAAPYPGLNVYGVDLRGCGLLPYVINSFLSSEVESGDGYNLLQYVDNVRPSDSVVLYSVGNPLFSSWSSNVLTKLGDLGISSTQISSLQDGEPVIIFTKKGAVAGSAKIYRSSTAPITSQDVTVASTITGRYVSGIIKSPLIGPSKKWVKFLGQAKEVESTDQVSYSIYGVSLKGAETLIQSGVIGQLDLSFIDPAQYPLLRVVMNMKDDVNLTAVQLKKWFILYESVADGLLFYQGPLTTQTVQEGQSFTGQYGFTNISSKSFADSLQVFAETNTVAKAYRQTSSFKIKAPAPGDTTKFSVTIHSQGKSGFNDVNVFVNPKIQPEQYYENNAIDLAGYLDVLTDVSKPLLDVTVDRRYLKNGDFVSSSPAIQIKLHDDNRFLFISDTTHINAFLSYPCDLTPCPYERINFSRSDVQWSSSSTGSDFTFNFNPTNLPQGLYALQVNGSDASGNMSGIDPYEVTFQIKNETALTLKAVYPNPSNDIFNFSFVLSGNELPHDFSLQIFSLDGQLVQQFGSNDVSTFIVGTNELHWSTAGANMPNGLFAYRLTIKVNEKTVSQSGKLMLIK